MKDILLIAVLCGFWMLLKPMWRKASLVVLFWYVSVYFNPPVSQGNQSNGITREENGILYVQCPDLTFIQLESGDFIRCEDFNEYFAARHQGIVRHDLIKRRDQL